MNLDDAPTFLSADEIRREIARYRYRADWELLMFVDPWEGPCLYVRAQVPNAYDTTETTELRIRSAIPPMKTLADLDIWMQWRMSQIESHEARELLRRDGKPLFDPHDPVEPGPAVKKWHVVGVDDEALQYTWQYGYHKSYPSAGPKDARKPRDR